MPKKYQLKNGIQVFLYPSRRAPVVSIQAWVGTGSADEKKGEEGISHFIEHLLFKGSRDFGVGEMAKTVESHGGQINAYTTFDQTVFYCTLSSEFTSQGMHVISNMLGFPDFDESEIDREREVVIEEIKRSLDNPRQVISRELFATLYGKHPYAIPIIGYEENIRTVTPKKIRKYFSDRYSPRNMKVLIVGDFDDKIVKKQVQETFGGIRPSPLVRRKRKAVPAVRGMRCVAKKAAFNETHIYLAWPAPKTVHKDIVGLSILAMILGSGETSRLVHRLRNQDNIVNSVGASLFSAKDEGLIVISASLAPDRIADFLKATGEEVARVLKDGVTSEELERVKTQIESERYYSFETVDALASLIGHYEFFYGDYKKFEAQIRETAQMTPLQIWKMTRKYLNVKKVNAICLSQQDEKQVKQIIETGLKKWPSMMTGKAVTPKVKKYKGGVQLKMKIKKSSSTHANEVVRLPSGGRLVLKRIEGSTVIATRIGWLGGARLDKEQHYGLNELFCRVWGTGTQNKSESEFNKYIESRAGNLSAFAGKNTVGLSAASLIPVAEDFSALMSELTENPRFEQAVIERELKLMKEYAKNRADKPMQKCMLHLARIIFPGHVYGRDIYETLDRLDHVGAGELARHLQQHTTTPLVVSVAGDIDRKKWEKFALKIAEASKSTAQVKEQSTPTLENPAYHFDWSEKQQTHLALAFKGLSYKDDRRPTLDCLQAVLSGQGGRLFVELRDKASLAYSVSPIRTDGLEGGYFGAYIGCSPEKANTAVKMMRDELQKMINQPVSQTELMRAKQYLIGKHDISLQRTSSISDELFFNEIYGVSVDTMDRYKERISAVTVADIQKLAGELFNSHPALSVVGPKDVLI